MATQYSVLNLSQQVTATSYAILTNSTQNLRAGDPHTLAFGVKAGTSHAVGVLLEFADSTSFSAVVEEYGLGTVPAGESRNWRWPLDKNDPPFGWQKDSYYGAVRLKISGVASTGDTVTVSSWLKKTT